MHNYEMITYPINSGILATIDNQFALGAFQSEEAAQGAYDAWAEMQEGKQVSHVYDDMGLLALPIGATYQEGGIGDDGLWHGTGRRLLRNLNNLDNAAQTSERVYVGTGDGIFPEEQVLTSSHVTEYAEHLQTEWGTEEEEYDDERVLDACTEVNLDILQMLRGVVSGR